VLADAGYKIVKLVPRDAAVALWDLQNLRLIVTDINLPGRLMASICLPLHVRPARHPRGVHFRQTRTFALPRVLAPPAAFLQKPFTLGTWWQM